MEEGAEAAEELPAPAAEAAAVEDPSIKDQQRDSRAVEEDATAGGSGRPAVVDEKGQTTQWSSQSQSESESCGELLLGAVR